MLGVELLSVAGTSLGNRWQTCVGTALERVSVLGGFDGTQTVANRRVVPVSPLNVS